MIVCFCVTTTKSDIDAAIADGAHTVEQVGARCGAGTGCGSCREYIEDVIVTSGTGCPGGGCCSECIYGAGQASSASPERFDDASSCAA